MLGHLGRMDVTRLARQLLWATLEGGQGRRGRRSNPWLPQVFAFRLEGIQDQLSERRRAYQQRMSEEGGNLHGFSWLIACQDRDDWRLMIGYRDIDRDEVN